MVNRYVRLVVAASLAVIASALLQSVGLPFTSGDVQACAGPGVSSYDWC
jgi:hypothetical protein